jgi:hypothetical protein
MRRTGRTAETAGLARQSEERRAIKRTERLGRGMTDMADMTTKMESAEMDTARSMTHAGPTTAMTIGDIRMESDLQVAGENANKPDGMANVVTTRENRSGWRILS